MLWQTNTDSTHILNNKFKDLCSAGRMEKFCYKEAQPHLALRCMAFAMKHANSAINKTLSFVQEQIEMNEYTNKLHLKNFQSEISSPTFKFYPQSNFVSLLSFICWVQDIFTIRMILMQAMSFMCARLNQRIQIKQKYWSFVYFVEYYSCKPAKMNSFAINEVSVKRTEVHCNAVFPKKKDAWAQLPHQSRKMKIYVRHSNCTRLAQTHKWLAKISVNLFCQNSIWNLFYREYNQIFNRFPFHYNQSSQVAFNLIQPIQLSRILYPQIKTNRSQHTLYRFVMLHFEFFLYNTFQMVEIHF